MVLEPRTGLLLLPLLGDSDSSEARSDLWHGYTMVEDLRLGQISVRQRLFSPVWSHTLDERERFPISSSALPIVSAMMSSCGGQALTAHNTT